MVKSLLPRGRVSSSDRTSIVKRFAKRVICSLNPVVSILRARDPGYELRVATWTLSRGSSQSASERFAALGARPISLAEEWFVLNKCGSRFHESLDVGTAHSLTVSVFALLFPALLSLESVGHNRATGVQSLAISRMWHYQVEDMPWTGNWLNLKSASFRRWISLNPFCDSINRQIGLGRDLGLGAEGLSLEVGYSS